MITLNVFTIIKKKVKLKIMHKNTLLQKLISKSFFLQNLALKYTNLKNVTVDHNLGKMMTLNKIFYFLEYEEIPGDYFEFGLFQGTSFIAAMNAYKKYCKTNIINRSFYGFDSFSGIGIIDENDKHPTYKKGLLISKPNTF